MGVGDNRCSGAFFVVLRLALAAAIRNFDSLPPSHLRSALLVPNPEKYVLCNAFPDEGSLVVSTKKEHLGTDLAFKQCEHYSVDRAGGEGFFLEVPGGLKPLDALSFPDAPSLHDCNSDDRTCIVILSRLRAPTPKGKVQWQILRRKKDKPVVSTIDAVDGGAFAAMGRNSDISDAVVRVEDIVKKEIEVQRQIIAARTLSLGREYDLPTGKFHLALEGLGGDQAHNYEDVEFRNGHQYLVLRLGKPGSEKYPEQLVFREVSEKSAAFNPAASIGLLFALMVSLEVF